MKQTYFVYNDKRYDIGTIIILYRFDIYSRRVCRTKAKFVWYDAELKRYSVEIYGKEYIYEEESFKKDFLGIYEPHKTSAVMQASTNHKTYTFSDELNIDGLLIAWIWYVFIMVVAIIFYARIGIWILASIIFFDYRNKKLKEAGYK
jgi:hypothetical protein